MMCKPIRRADCRKAQQLSDAFVDHELPGDQILELLRHLIDCGDCAEQIKEKSRLKRQIQASVRGSGVPGALRWNILAGIRSCTS